MQALQHSVCWVKIALLIFLLDNNENYALFVTKCGFFHVFPPDIETMKIEVESLYIIQQ